MKKPNKKIIVFDLDETLIHATKKKLSIIEDFIYEDYYIYKRPNVDVFLQECCKLYSIAIWSSADDEYVNSIVHQLIKDVCSLAFIWGRSECWMKVRNIEDELGLKRKEYLSIKPLEKIRKKGFKMDNLLIIDDSKYKVVDNPDNYIIIEPFVGDMKDNELSKLLNYFQNIIPKGSFRNPSNRNWRDLSINS
ncbi:MAG: HAD family hydrolase [Bacteroidota bacterium]